MVSPLAHEGSLHPEIKVLGITDAFQSIAKWLSSTGRWNARRPLPAEFVKSAPYDLECLTNDFQTTRDSVITSSITMWMTRHRFPAGSVVLFCLVFTGMSLLPDVMKLITPLSTVNGNVGAVLALYSLVACDAKSWGNLSFGLGSCM
jgi:hypothetical protein